MGVKKYAQEVIKEGKRVRWPKWEDFWPTLVVVIVICTIAALILSLEDWAAGTLINQLRDIFSTVNGGGGDSTSEAVSVAAIALFLGGF